MRKVGSLLVLGMLSSMAHAVVNTYDLTTDFSNSANPNGVWAFWKGVTLLTHYAQSTTTNALNPGVANGYWGTEADTNYGPGAVFRVTQNGSALNTNTGSTADDYTDGDFLIGDVVVHSVNGSQGDPQFGAEPDLLITWTAPSAGTISFEGSVWYAHSIVDRSNLWILTLDGNQYFSGAVQGGNNRNNRDAFSWLVPTTVDLGDVLMLRLEPLGDTGSLAGLTLKVDFTTQDQPPGPSAPEPGTLALFGLGLAGLGAVRRKKLAARILATTQRSAGSPVR